MGGRSAVPPPSPPHSTPPQGQATGFGCAPCPVGTFNNATGATRCRVCGPGTIAPEEGTVECEYCPRNTINTDGLDGAAREVTNHDDADDCTACDAGETANEDRIYCQSQCSAGEQPTATSGGYVAGEMNRVVGSVGGAFCRCTMEEVGSRVGFKPRARGGNE